MTTYSKSLYISNEYYELGDNMIKNVGKIDKIIRIILAVVSVYFANKYSPWIYILTAILFGTAVMGHCGLYKPFGISTCPVKKK